jgi:HNH endonuclease
MSPGDVLSYIEMCSSLGVNLQRGMNYRLCGDCSLILMSLRPGAPYEDQVKDAGKVLIYEGHNAPRTKDCPDPKSTDQPGCYPGGRPTQNGLFLIAAEQYKAGQAPAERVKVFEKIRAGIWVYNGLFVLTNAWSEQSKGRRVFKFKLELTDSENLVQTNNAPETDRVIPSAVKLEVWKRDKGQCALCGARTNLHFDHIIPYSQGGSSRDEKNIQILCAKHNLEKRDRIM